MQAQHILSSSLDTKVTCLDTHTPDVQKVVTPTDIILVDDDIDDRAFTMRSLQRSKFVKGIQALNDGEDLFAYLREQGWYDRSVTCWRPILIVLDLNMPKVDGFEVLRQIKADQFIKNIPVVVLSSQDTMKRAMEAVNLGAVGFMSKPVNLEKLESFFDLSWQWPPKEMF